MADVYNFPKKPGVGNLFTDVLNSGGSIVAKRGDKGEKVKEIQQLLISRSYNVGPTGADGDFGANTEGAVKAFQLVAKLPVTGVVDTATYNALKAPVSYGQPGSGSQPVAAQPPSTWPVWKTALIIGGGLMVAAVVFRAMRGALGEGPDESAPYAKRTGGGGGDRGYVRAYNAVPARKCRINKPASVDLEDAEIIEPVPGEG